MARTKVSTVPEIGDEAPDFSLPSAQGGQLRLSVRTARGPVVVVFYGDAEPEEDIEYFKALAEKEDEINMAAASVAGIGVVGPEEARDLVSKAGIKSYILYDYARVATRDWGLLEKDKQRGEYSRSAVFIVGADREVVHAWVDERPPATEILAKVSEITGLPKPPEEGDKEKPEKPAKAKAKGGEDSDTHDAQEKPEREKPSSEERKAAPATEQAPESDAPKAEKPKAKEGESSAKNKAEAEEEKPGE